jgi:hypothetical protein
MAERERLALILFLGTSKKRPFWFVVGYFDRDGKRFLFETIKIASGCFPRRRYEGFGIHRGPACEAGHLPQESQGTPLFLG